MAALIATPTTKLQQQRRSCGVNRAYACCMHRATTDNWIRQRPLALRRMRRTQLQMEDEGASNLPQAPPQIWVMTWYEYSCSYSYTYSYSLWHSHSLAVRKFVPETGRASWLEEVVGGCWPILTLQCASWDINHLNHSNMQLPSWLLETRTPLPPLLASTKSLIQHSLKTLNKSLAAKCFTYDLPKQLLNDATLFAKVLHFMPAPGLMALPFPMPPHPLLCTHTPQHVFWVWVWVCSSGCHVKCMCIVHYTQVATYAKCHIVSAPSGHISWYYRLQQK